MKKSSTNFLKSFWFWTVVIIIAAVGLIFWARSSPSTPTFESSPVVVADIIETVGVTGTVSPTEKIDLAFKKSGVISEINFKVGDRVKKGEALAALDNASDRAALASAKATLADISRNLTPEELSVAQAALDKAKKDAENALHDSLTKVQSALFSYTDTFYNNPQTMSPVISIRTDSYNQSLNLNTERLGITTILNSWTSDIAATNSEEDPAIRIARIHGYMNSIKNFMTDLSNSVSAISPANSGLSQATINTYASSMNSGLATFNSAMDAITTAETALTTAETNYNLKLAGNSSQSIAAQAAKVAQAQAEYDSSILYSPIDGIITKVEPEAGEYIAAGHSGFSVQNNSFKIEAYVPEADIAKVAIGNEASTTLDAYGSGIDFPAHVVTIDPAETILEGVPTYKVTLVFDSADPRVRSGMTVNLEIHTRSATNVLSIPYRAVIDNSGVKTVRVVAAGGKTWTTQSITVGLKGSSGTIEVTSGLNVGDKVVTYVK